MKICAVVSEFNVFHNGHAYLLSQLRLKGFTHIITVMSGNFVQRGEAAIVSKAARAKMALKGGCDLVVELPTVNVLVGAEKYAFGAMSLIKHIGCVDAIAFGSESGDLKQLILIKEAMKSPEFGELLKAQLDKGATFYAAREKALLEILKDEKVSKEIKTPNNILGIEYLKAIDALKLDVKMLTIKRLSDLKLYSSASRVREMILKNQPDYKMYIPEASYQCMRSELDNQAAPVEFFSNDKVIFSKLRRMNLSEFENLPDISEGLEHRVFKSVGKSSSLNDLLFDIKTKRYPLSRIRRIITCAFLGIDSKVSKLSTPYIRVLASNAKGFEILRKMKKTATLPIITRYNDILNQDVATKNFFELESKFTDLYNTLTPKILPCGLEKTFKLIKD